MHVRRFTDLTNESGSLSPARYAGIIVQPLAAGHRGRREYVGTCVSVKNGPFARIRPQSPSPQPRSSPPHPAEVTPMAFRPPRVARPNVASGGGTSIPYRTCPACAILPRVSPPRPQTDGAYPVPLTPEQPSAPDHQVGPLRQDRLCRATSPPHGHHGHPVRRAVTLHGARVADGG